MEVQERNTKDQEKQNFVVEGYAFCSQRDADLAAQEQKKAEYLRTRIDYSRPESVLKIYEKALKEKVFQTPVGIRFLKELQDFLKNDPNIDQEKISPISLNMTFDSQVQERPVKAKSKVQPFSILLNIVLMIAVIAMFVITLKAEQPNILNYEDALLNRYADWEQQLTEREQAVREKERELLTE